MGIKIVCLNCRSIRARRKELEIYLNENEIDILAVNETYLTPKTTFSLPGYDVIRNDRSDGSRGGVAFLVKTEIIMNK